MWALKNSFLVSMSTMYQTMIDYYSMFVVSPNEVYQFVYGYT